MIARTYSDIGFILGRKTFGEADRIISVLSKNHGRINVLAKGVRRPKSKKRGHLEVFTLINFQATSGKGVGIVTEAETINSFEDIRKNLNKVTLAYYFSEVVAKITHEHEKNEVVFETLKTHLLKLEETQKLKELKKEFIYQILTVTGFWPKEKELHNPDQVLEEVLERNISSIRVGKRVLI